MAIPGVTPVNPDESALGAAPPPPAATPTAAAVPRRSGDLRADLSQRALPGRGSEAFREPSAAELDAYQAAVSKLLQEGATVAAQAALAELRYAVSLYTDARGAEFLVLEDTDATRGGGTVVVNLAPSRDLILEAPHSDSDAGTGGQATAMFFQLGARALLLNGAHRCASSAKSACSPENTFCGDGGRISDAAQHPFTFFTAAHRAMRAAFPQALAASIHGMDADGPEAAVISDGTRIPKAGAVSVRLRDGINAALGAGSATRAFSCNDTADNGKFRPLCGTTNAQASVDNQSADACLSEPTGASDRFVHVEQGEPLRQQHTQSAEPDAVTQAFAAVVPCALGAGGLGCPAL